MDQLPPPPPAIIVTASRANPAAPPIASQSDVDQTRLDRLGLPLVGELLRALPGVAIATSGTAGSQTQLRLRGNEANHTLLVIDGIRANDPAAANEPRFELIGADLVSSLRLIRGPQSALYGSEAIGGVIAVDSGGTSGSQLLAEAGSHASLRTSARTTIKGRRGRLTLGAAFQRAGGINAFAAVPADVGERDGYRNLALRARGEVQLAPSLLLDVAGFAIRGRTQFDGSSPLTFARADTLDWTQNRLHAGRIGVTIGTPDRTYARLGGSVLGSTNANHLDTRLLNTTRARRAEFQAEAGTRFTTGPVRHAALIAFSAEDEDYRARDTGFGGATNQDRGRARQSLTLGWNGALASGATLDLALRHDRFTRFKDATSFRAALWLPLIDGLGLAASWGQGIAQPSFTDLYGFFPRSFRGNPDLRPERSTGGEIALRYAKGPWRASVTAYRQRLNDEILTRFDPLTFLSSPYNATGTSHRRGIEVETGWSPSAALRLSGQLSRLHATQPGTGGVVERELRRPRTTAAIAADGRLDRLSYAVQLAHVGARWDQDFDRWPATRVRLDPYTLLSARVGWRVGAAELFVRASNALGEQVRDVVGYRGEGRTIHGGLSLRFGD